MAAQEIIVIRVNVYSTSDEGKEMSAADWFDRGLSWWRARATRVIECDLVVIVDCNNVVVGVGRVSGVQKDIDGGSGRISISALPQPESHLLGKTIRVNGSRNPISFVTSLEIV